MGAMKEGPAWVPTHPGEVLRNDVLPALEVSVSTAAEGMQISRQSLHAVLTGRASVTPEMALRIGRYTDTDPELWLRMQQARDLHLAADGMKGKLAGIIPFRRTVIGIAKFNPVSAKPAISARFMGRSATAASGSQQAHASRGRGATGGNSAGTRAGKAPKSAR